MNASYMSFLALAVIVAGCTKTGPDTEPERDVQTVADTADLLKGANRFWSEDKFEDALALVNQAIEIDGETPSLLDYQCDLLFKLERGEELLECTMLLEQISPKKTPWNYLKIADAHVFLRNEDAAIDWIEKAVREREFRKFDVFEAARYDLIRDDLRFKVILDEILADLDIGKPAKVFVATLVDGSEISLSSLRGQVVLIDFWATWCPPCLEELPNLEALYESYHDDGFEILSICLDEGEDVSRARDFLAQRQLPWKLRFSEQGYEDEIVKLYKVNGLPSTWLIDREGNLHRVAIHGDELGDEVAKLVTRPAPPQEG
jgi:thiol-disulfide isomerase/thioredoxin